MSVNEKMTAIADAIRKRTKGTEQLTLDDMATEITNVYDTGKNHRTRDFWERITGNGRRTNYNNGFRNTDLTGETFPEDLFTIKNSPTLFYNYYGTHLPQGVDLSQINTTLGTSSSHAYNIVGNSPNLEEIYDWKMPAMLDYYYSFQGCPMLRKIAKVRVVKESTFAGAFNALPSLEEIGFEGVIGNYLNLSECPKLSHDTLLNVIDCLYNYSSSGTTKTLTLGTTNLAKLTNAEKAIATEKGWSLA